MSIEVALQSFSSLILPTIYLFIIATFIFTRSYHVYIGKMVALVLTSTAIAYLFDYIRLLAPIEYSHFLHVFVILFFMSLSFSLIVHMLYTIIQKTTAIRIPLLPYALYIYPIAMPLYGLLEQFIIGHLGYYKADGWIYRGGNGIVMFNLYFTFVMCAINLGVLAIGIKHAKTKQLKQFFKGAFLYTVLCTAGILVWHAGIKQFHSITPPTPSLPFLLWSGTFYAILITKLGFIPSVVKRHSSLLESSPTPIVYLNEKWMITEANLAATRLFHMKK
ncbi:MAG: hypothetical protein ABS949_08895 [Solibacillus sp.]